VTLTDPQGEEVGDAELREVSLATVDDGAVRDVGAAQNTIGDHAIGTSRTETPGRRRRDRRSRPREHRQLHQPAG
jgi:hypothetical protein